MESGAAAAAAAASSSSSSSSSILTEQQLRSCRRELDMSLRVLELFKSGILIVDEIDEVLHPLKSELHWPMGQRQPLDFTAAPGDVSLAASTSSASAAAAAAAQQQQQQQIQQMQTQQQQSAAAAAAAAAAAGAAAAGISEPLISPRQIEEPLLWLFCSEEGMRWQLPWFLLDPIFYFYT